MVPESTYLSKDMLPEDKWLIQSGSGHKPAFPDVAVQRFLRFEGFPADVTGQLVPLNGLTHSTRVTPRSVCADAQHSGGIYPR